MRAGIKVRGTSQFIEILRGRQIIMTLFRPTRMRNYGGRSPWIARRNHVKIWSSRPGFIYKRKARLNRVSTSPRQTELLGNLSRKRVKWPGTCGKITFHFLDCAISVIWSVAIFRDFQQFAEMDSEGRVMRMDSLICCGGWTSPAFRESLPRYPHCTT